jgi:hypothetical protein
MRLTADCGLRLDVYSRAISRGKDCGYDETGLTEMKRALREESPVGRRPMGEDRSEVAMKCEDLRLRAEKPASPWGCPQQFSDRSDF